MHPSTLLSEDGSVCLTAKAHAFRVGRLELCSAWAPGELPSRVYILWLGRSFPGASAFTLRVYRAMVGFRWYDKPFVVTPAIGRKSRWA